MRRASVFLDFAAVVIVKGGRRQDAQYQAHTAFVRTIRLGTVYQIDVVQRYLPGFEHDITREIEIDLAFVDDLSQRVVVAVIEMMRENLVIPV